MLVIFKRLGLNRVLRLVAQTNNQEIMTAASLLIVIGVATLVDAVGLSMGLGAFIAGMMLANSSFRHQLHPDIEPFKGILLGLFFIAVGMTLDLSLMLEQPLLMLGGALALVACKTLIIVGILHMGEVPFRESFQLGLMLSQGGEFAFVVLSQATQLGVFAAELSQQLTLVVGLSMGLTSPIVMLHRKFWGCRSKQLPDQDAYWDTHAPEVIIAGFGRFGQIVGRILQVRHVPFSAIDKDPAHVEFVKQFGNKLYFGDLSRMDLLKSAGVSSAKILVVAIDNEAESLQMIAMAKELSPDIKIIATAIDRGHAYELHRLGVASVIRETFASSLEAATDTLKNLGYSDGQALQTAQMFRNHDEALLLQSVAHMDDIDELRNLTRKGRLELEKLFAADSKNPVSA